MKQFERKIIDQFSLLDELNNDSSSWHDVRSFPDSITARRMIRLADFAADNPKRWHATKMWHLHNLDADYIAVALKVSKATVYRFLQPVRLDADDDYPDIF